MGRIVVVGGGYSGASAATAMAEQGHQVDLLESRGSLGGRVYSIPPSDAFPAPVDNGPHLFMGCYHETLRFLRRVGASDFFHWVDPLRLAWFVPGGKKLHLRCGPLPAPLHLAWGLWGSNAFSPGEKISLARALVAFSKNPFRLKPGIETVAQFLEESRQGPGAQERFWIPLCHAVMNVSPEIAPMKGLGTVLNRMFFGSRRDSALAVASRPLSEIGFPQVEPYLKQRGGAVWLREGTKTFTENRGSIRLVTRSEKGYTPDALVWAVPPSSLAALWPPGTWPAVESLALLGKSPIISVHVILSLPVTQEHFVGMPGASFEWVFNRNANWGWNSESQGPEQYLSFTASAASNLALRTEKQWVDLALGELRERYPKALLAHVLHSKVTREMAATFVWSKASDPLRLTCETPFPNVFLAGDWTATGLPATIEGACLSGHKAAEKVGEYMRKNQ